MLDGCVWLLIFKSFLLQGDCEFRASRLNQSGIIYHYFIPEMAAIFYKI